jgi:hypothetical protein
MHVDIGQPCLSVLIVLFYCLVQYEPGAIKLQPIAGTNQIAQSTNLIPEVETLDDARRDRTSTLDRIPTYAKLAHLCV